MGDDTSLHKYCSPQESRAPFFMELIDSLSYVKILKKVKDRNKSRAMQELVDAFNDVSLHEKGEKKLKTANHLLVEL